MAHVHRCYFCGDVSLEPCYHVLQPVTASKPAPVPKPAPKVDHAFSGISPQDLTDSARHAADDNRDILMEQARGLGLHGTTPDSFILGYAAENIMAGDVVVVDMDGNFRRWRRG